jgi:TolB protein
MPLRISLRRACAVALLPLATAFAQDTTRGVRIGLTYDPGTRPGVVVLPIRAATGDSLKTIFERDFGLSNRLAALPLADAGAGTMPGGGLNYRFFGTMGAAAVVQASVAGGNVHVALHDVAKGSVINVADFPLAETTYSREWRHAVHGIADSIEAWITLRRGIAQTRIAFIRLNVVHVIDFDGEQEQPIPAPAPALSPAWHPNGRMLAYNTFGPESRIILHDVQAKRVVRNFGAQRNVTNLTPTFTPDGRSVVYSISTENGADLYQLSLDGEAFPRRVTVGRGSENVGPSFSPDGNRVAFTSDRTGTPQVYISDADGTNADIFTAFDFGDQNDRAAPDWSPDGRQIAFQSRIDGRFQIMTMSIRDRQPRQLTSEGENEDPSWAPDGRHLVFVSTRTGTQQLWILDTESGKLRQLTRLGGTRLPAWSPRFGTK